LCLVVLPLVLVHSLWAGSLLAVLQVWQRRALQVLVLQLRGRQVAQDHKLPRRRGRQRELAPDVHPKVQAVAQMVGVLPDLVLRAARPIAQVILQTHQLSVQVLAARLHPFGVRIQVKKRPGPAMATRHPPKVV
jgi:hypothetical protein